MKRKTFTILLFSLFGQFVFSQSDKQIKEGVIPKSINSINVGAGIATGNFSNTHSIGFSAIYQHSISLREKKANFTLAGMFLTQLGKKETVSGYPYKYPVYNAIAAMAGVSYSPFRKVTSSLIIGPGLTAYNQVTHFAITSTVSFQYKISRKFLAGVSITGLKTKESSTLFIAGLNGALILN